MRYVWGVPCVLPIVDASSSKLSAIDIPETLMLKGPAPEYPHPEGLPVGLKLGFTYVAVFWCGEDDSPDAEVRLFWRFPDGKRELLRESNARVVTEVRNISVRFLLEIEAAEYRGLGIYWLDLETRSKGGKKWQKVSSYPLVVKLIPESATNAPEQPSGQTPAALPETSLLREPSRP